MMKSRPQNNYFSKNDLNFSCVITSRYFKCYAKNQLRNNSTVLCGFWNMFVFSAWVFMPQGWSILWQHFVHLQHRHLFAHVYLIWSLLCPLSHCTQQSRFYSKRTCRITLSCLTIFFSHVHTHTPRHTPTHTYCICRKFVTHWDQTYSDCGQMRHMGILLSMQHNQIIHSAHPQLLTQRKCEWVLWRK